MRLSRTIAIAFALAGALTGCGDSTAPAIAIDVIGAPGDAFVSGQRLPPAGRLVRAATAEGLVAFDSGGGVVPALADRWIVTADGSSYIFRLRDGTWADGSNLTGESARDALRAAIAGLRGTTLGQDLGAVSEVRAMAGRVVEIRLAYPVPDFLDLLAQPELGLLGKGRATGSMVLRRKEGLAQLIPVPPEQRGIPQPRSWKDSARTISLRAMPAADAIKSFDAGTIDAVFGGTVADYPLAVSAAGLGRRALRMDPVAGLFGLAVQAGSGVLASPEGREALAMAIDRDALASDLGIREWQPTTRIVPVGMVDSPAGAQERWADMDIAKRRTAAMTRLARWTVKGGDAIALRIALPMGPGGDTIWRRLAADLAAIGVRARRVGEGEAADLRLVDSVARYSRADWFLNQFACGAGRGQCSAPADAAAAAALRAPTQDARAQSLATAIDELTQANVFIPLGNPIRWSLVREPLPGFALNPWGWHPLSPIAMPPK